MLRRQRHQGQYLAESSAFASVVQAAAADEEEAPSHMVHSDVGSTAEDTLAAAAYEKPAIAGT